MFPVVIESPYGGDVKRNVEYAWRCVRDSCQRGEAPFASHLFYTVAVDKYAQESNGKSDPEHWITREEGIKRCEVWRNVATKTIFYVDLGWSAGMLQAKEHAEKLNQPIEIRFIG